MLLLLGPPFPMPLLFATTIPQLLFYVIVSLGWTISHIVFLVLIAKQLRRWEKYNDERQRYNDEQKRILDERARESERRHAESMQQLHALIERTAGDRRPGLSGR